MEITIRRDQVYAHIASKWVEHMPHLCSITLMDRGKREGHEYLLSWVRPKLSYLCTRIHGVTSKNTVR
jgi:hypothetical protein